MGVKKNKPNYKHPLQGRAHNNKKKRVGKYRALTDDRVEGNGAEHRTLIPEMKRGLGL